MEDEAHKKKENETCTTEYWYVSAINLQYLKCAYKYICISQKTTRERDRVIPYNAMHLLPISVVANNKITPFATLVLTQKHRKSNVPQNVSASHPLQHHHTRLCVQLSFWFYCHIWVEVARILLTVIHLFADCIAPMEITMFCGAIFLLPLIYSCVGSAHMSKY